MEMEYIHIYTGGSIKSQLRNEVKRWKCATFVMEFRWVFSIEIETMQNVQHVSLYLAHNGIFFFFASDTVQPNLILYTN